MTIRARLAAWVARNVIGPDPWPEYSRLDRMDGRAPVVVAGCMDCGWQDPHHTTTAATAALEAHSFDRPGHRALISDTNGWHRVFGEWLADSYRAGPAQPGTGMLTKDTP